MGIHPTVPIKKIKGAADQFYGDDNKLALWRWTLKARRFFWTKPPYCNVCLSNSSDSIILRQVNTDRIYIFIQRSFVGLSIDPIFMWLSINKLCKVAWEFMKRKSTHSTHPCVYTYCTNRKRFFTHGSHLMFPEMRLSVPN